MLDGPAEMVVAERLLSRVWGGNAVQLDAATMRAFAHSGNYVAGVFDTPADSETPELIGCAVGFFGPPEQLTLHSHIAAVDPRYAGRGIGTTLKNHQRAWCRERGVTSITWTFDPAIARNAYFNLAKLGVAAVRYLEDFYGSLTDDRNAGSPSDRLLVRWDLTGPPFETRSIVYGASAPEPGPTVPYALRVGADSAPLLDPVDPSADTLLVQVPPDIEGLRHSDAPVAARWRLALREVLAPYVNSAEWRVTGFSKQGSYVVERIR